MLKSIKKIANHNLRHNLVITKHWGVFPKVGIAFLLFVNELLYSYLVMSWVQTCESSSLIEFQLGIIEKSLIALVCQKKYVLVVISDTIINLKGTQ